MSHRTRLAMAGSIAALALALTGCSGGGTVTVETTPAETTPVEAPAAKPDAYKGRILDIISADTLRVQIHTDVYGGTEQDAADPRTVVVHDPRIDAPDNGECGFEESRDYMIRENIGTVWPKSAQMPDEPWTPEEDFTVTLENADLLEAGYPETEGKAELFEVSYRGDYGSNGWTNSIDKGYARLAEDLPEEYRWYDILIDAQERAEKRTETTREAPDVRTAVGLYATCWADLHTGDATD